MKRDVAACILLIGALFYPSPGGADTVYLNDGRTIEAEKISEKEGLLKCHVNGITIYYPIADIDRVERKQIKGAKQTPERNRAESQKAPGTDVNPDLIKRCYELGYRYGLCAAKRMYNIQCERKNDIVIPERCRGKAETEKGMVVGIAETHASRSTPKGTSAASASINIESTPIEALQETLIGKTKREVQALAGRPNRVTYFAGHELWVYGDSRTSEDKAVAFEGEIVKDVVFF